MQPSFSARPLGTSCFLTVAAGALLVLGACHNSNDPAPLGIATEPVVGTKDALPGVVVTIQDVRGSRGSGKAVVGDRLVVDFTVATTAGDPLELSTMARGGIMVSGPTNNYQRVIESQSDILAKSVKRAVGAYTYTFAAPIPSAYLAPLNDSNDLTEGELTGQALVSGTYTVGIELRKDYQVGSSLLRDPGNVSADFLLGDATTLEPREVVTLANCNQCHTELRAHGENRDKITNCLLCHTAGAEDRIATVAGGTPGVTIDFKVMIHKIHAGRHLPSVLGVATNSNGSRNYDATPQPYEIVGYGNSINDFSDVNFPAWPAFYTPMPRDAGYTTLTSTQQSLENTMRGGPIECDKCHGDPDGSGPLAAPTQGDLIYSQPSIAACQSCHDDWNPAYPYTSNGSTMLAQLDNAACKDCHRVSGNTIDIVDAHRHPLVDPDVVSGVHFNVTLADVGGNSDGKLQAGEKVGITFQVVDDAGNPIAASSLSRIECELTGPTTNPQILTTKRIAQSAFSGNGPYTVNFPAFYWYESIGTSTGTTGETFSTAHAPHWNVTGDLTALFRRTGTTTHTTLAATAEVTQNYIDVASSTGFAKDDYIVIDDGTPGTREYMRIQWVQGNRLWFASQFRTTYKPNLLIAHASGVSVDEVTLASVPTSSYTLDTVTGLVTETVEFGNGEIISNYTSDFIVPDHYPGALNESPAGLGNQGNWVGLPLLDGTYTFDMHGARSLTVTRAGENTTYTEGADATIVHILYGSATTIEVVDRVASAETCYNCHERLQFHGGSRTSVETCLQCHGTAGAQNTKVYENQNTGSPVDELDSVEFRSYAHRLHRDVFPSMPGVQDCSVCHGSSTAWVQPAEREHPNQVYPTRAWSIACGGCHDSTPATAHMDANTSNSGYEACAICHGEGRDQDVRSMHLIR